MSLSVGILKMPLPKMPEKIGTSLILNLAFVVLGAVVGRMIRNKILLPNLNYPIYKVSEGATLTVGGIASPVIAFLLIVFGGKAHALLQWFGVGWFGSEMADWVGMLLPTGMK